MRGLAAESDGEFERTRMPPKLLPSARVGMFEAISEIGRTISRGWKQGFYFGHGGGLKKKTATIFT